MDNPEETSEPESELERLARDASAVPAPLCTRPASRHRRSRAAGACAIAAALATAGSLCLLKSMNAPRGASAFSPPATLPAPSHTTPTPSVYPEFHYPHPHYANTPAQSSDRPIPTGELFPEAKSKK